MTSTLVETKTLKVVPSTTSLTWDSTKRQSDIVMLNASKTAKLVSGKAGAKAVLGKTGYLIGTATANFTFEIHSGKTLHVGLAENTRNLASLAAGTDLASIMLSDIKSDTDATFVLTTTALTITYNGRTTSTSLTGYTGKTMYPWLSDDTNGNGFSVSIALTILLTIQSNGNDQFVIDAGTQDLVLTAANVSISGTFGPAGDLDLASASALLNVPLSSTAGSFYETFASVGNTYAGVLNAPAAQEFTATRTGNVVVVNLGTLVPAAATGGAGTFATTIPLPATLLPPADVQLFIAATEDGVVVTGSAVVDAGGIITFSVGVAKATFAGVADAGFQDAMLTFSTI